MTYKRLIFLALFSLSFQESWALDDETASGSSLDIRGKLTRILTLSKEDGRQLLEEMVREKKRGTRVLPTLIQVNQADLLSFIIFETPDNPQLQADLMRYMGYEKIF